jgi:hypothetical protein
LSDTLTRLGWTPEREQEFEQHRGQGLVAGRVADRYVLEPRGFVDLKGKGVMQTSFLTGRRPA